MSVIAAFLLNLRIVPVAPNLYRCRLPRFEARDRHRIRREFVATFWPKIVQCHRNGRNFSRVFDGVLIPRQIGQPLRRGCIAQPFIANPKS